MSSGRSGEGEGVTLVGYLWLSSEGQENDQTLGLLLLLLLLLLHRSTEDQNRLQRVECRLPVASPLRHQFPLSVSVVDRSAQGPSLRKVWNDRSLKTEQNGFE